MAKKPKRKPLAEDFQPPADFVDPRRQPGFQPELWPLLNGQRAPAAGGRGLHERRCLEFLAAFYHVNVANERLRQARSARAAQRVLRAHRARVAAATAALTDLEDRYAPIGFFGEPVMAGARCHNVLFNRPEVPKQYRRPPVQVVAFSIPGLAAIPESELRGRPKLRHMGYAGLDF
jgi:hypothetical protein